MTTKRKIIFGFLFVNIVLIAVAVIGYQSLDRSTGGLVRNEVLANSNVNLSDMTAALYRQGYNLERFLMLRDAKYSQSAAEDMKRCAELGRVVLNNMREEAHKAKMQAVLERCDQYVKLIAEIEKDTLAWNDQYLKYLRPAAAELQAALLAVAEGGKNAGNINALSQALNVWNAVMGLRTQITLFAQNGNPAVAQEMEKYFAASRKSVNDLAPYMTSEKGRIDFERISSALDALEKGIQAGEGLFLQVNRAVAKSYEYDKEIGAVLGELNQAAEQTMSETSTATIASNRGAQTFMLAVSAIGFAISVASAAFIIIGLIRILSRLGSYAEAVAGGDFGHDPQVKEKGEIGAMVDALKHIPATLSAVISDCNGVSGMIGRGDFRARLDEGNFRGGFKDLALGVNRVANAYTKVIDELPVSIMAADMERKIVFLNSLAQVVAGGNTLGEYCGDKLRAPECANEGCFGKRCQRENATINGDVAVETPQGTNHLNVSALPLFDQDGNPAGCMEIITDITQIKNQQITMAEVARRALDISDRVAAASEELSSQVEEISRGAEVQRSRVESTASAMTEMNATVLEVAKNAGEASEQSENTRNKAQEGANLVNQVVEAINVINSVGHALQNNMQELGTQAESIGNVMNVISDIADQTNLLALNAAIEAARAGEAGRGFAVVADEVRKLAEKTMDATQEVGASISAVQHSARVNIEEVGKAVEGVAEANGLANSSGEALSEIVDMASANSSVVASIATAAEEQSATSEEINRAVEEINQIVGETTEGMIQSSQAVQDLSRMAQELKAVLENLK